MKRILLVALTEMGILGIMASPVLAQTEITEVTLIADNWNIDSGRVAVSIEGDILQVTYQTIDGWEMTETHLYVGTEAPSKSAPGKFLFKNDEAANVTEDNYEVSLSELGIEAGQIVYLAAQAALQKPLLDEEGNPVLDEEGNQIYLEESAWAEGEQIRPNKNWAMYFAIEIPAAQ